MPLLERMIYNFLRNWQVSPAGSVTLRYALDSGSSDFLIIQVQVLLPAPKAEGRLYVVLSFFVQSLRRRFCACFGLRFVKSAAQNEVRKSRHPNQRQEALKTLRF